MKNARRPRTHAATAIASRRPMAPAVRFLLVILGVLVVGKIIDQLPASVIVSGLYAIGKSFLGKLADQLTAPTTRRTRRADDAAPVSSAA